jgi:hypothetical protein
MICGYNRLESEGSIFPPDLIFDLLILYLASLWEAVTAGLAANAGW